MLVRRVKFFMDIQVHRGDQTGLFFGCDETRSFETPQYETEGQVLEHLASLGEVMQEGDDNADQRT